MTEHNHEFIGIGYKDTFSWVAFDPERGEHYISVADDNHDPQFVQPNVEEMQYFLELSDWWRDRQQAGTVVQFADISSKPLRPRREQITLAEVQPKVYFDCVAEASRWPRHAEYRSYPLNSFFMFLTMRHSRSRISRTIPSTISLSFILVTSTVQSGAEQ